MRRLRTSGQHLKKKQNTNVNRILIFHRNCNTKRMYFSCSNSTKIWTKRNWISNSHNIFIFRQRQFMINIPIIIKLTITDEYFGIRLDHKKKNWGVCVWLITCIIAFSLCVSSSSRRTYNNLYRLPRSSNRDEAIYGVWRMKRLTGV